MTSDWWHLDIKMSLWGLSTETKGSRIGKKGDDFCGYCHVIHYWHWLEKNVSKVSDSATNFNKKEQDNSENRDLKRNLTSAVSYHRNWFCAEYKQNRDKFWHTKKIVWVGFEIVKQWHLYLLVYTGRVIKTWLHVLWHEFSQQQ